MRLASPAAGPPPTPRIRHSRLVSRALVSLTVPFRISRNEPAGIWRDATYLAQPGWTPLRFTVR